MINKFMKDPQTNSLAVLVLAILIVGWITLVVLILRDTPIRTDKSWHAKLLLVSPLLAVPAMLDILQTKGIALTFAVTTFLALLLNIVIPIMQATGKTSHRSPKNRNGDSMLRDPPKPVTHQSGSNPLSTAAAEKGC